MKRSIVPAQITTVEDRIVGGLTSYQLTLLLSPLCAGFVAYALLPPDFRLAWYKLGAVAVLELIGVLLSIRIKGRMLLFWFITIARYNTRPRFYIYDKNDPFLRDTAAGRPVAAAETPVRAEATPKPSRLPHLALPDVVKIEGIMADPRANLRFKAGKGGKLNAIIQEIK